ncbi:MAG TPA: ankyrin repeat domain-containing protein [Thermoanaerobaculia bacterium]|jgi:ankyrin repeat protein|nr:ankyrin repeat domain-containing protein [Thermoanaerobaculia bacterium]
MIEAYQRQARELFDALQAGDNDAAWRFKWDHPRFRDKDVSEVQPATLDLADAQIVVAQGHGFPSWSDLQAFVETLTNDARVAEFEAAVEAIIAGDADTLRSMLRANPELIRARSMRRHHATLLHYIGANGVENVRQKTPANAVEIAKLLLDAGAEVDALADMYDAKCTTMSMLVSSSPPADAGLQGKLAETLIDYGAAFDGTGSNWKSAVMTALAFGFRDTAQTLARRGAPIDNIAAAAGLGLVDESARLLPTADAQSRQIALSLAAAHGHAAVVQLLLDAGEDPDRYNPGGFHAHSTPLHQAALANHAEVVRLLAERGARLDIEDTLFHATPLGWAEHAQWTEIADYLRARSR